MSTSNNESESTDKAKNLKLLSILNTKEPIPKILPSWKELSDSGIELSTSIDSE